MVRFCANPRASTAHSRDWILGDRTDRSGKCIIRYTGRQPLFWTGYGGGASGFSFFGSFIQPAVTCSPLLTADQAAFFGVGSTGGGLVGGTEAFCAKGSGTPVYSIIGVSGALTVKAGDVIEVSSTVNIGSTCTIPRGNTGHLVTVTTTLKDITSGQSATNTSAPVCEFPAPSAHQSTCLVASASEGGTAIPLANFGTALFGGDFTHVAGTCLGTAGFVGVPILLFIQKNGAGTGLLAKPSIISDDFTSFKVIWRSAGP